MKELQVDGYRIDLTKPLGAGFSSHVYPAHSLLTQLPYAAKIVPIQKLSEIQLMLLRNEVRAMQLVSHKNVLSAAHVSYLLDRTIILSELCQGGQLQEIINKGLKSQSQNIGIFYKICQGYLHIYNKGIIHRDLKPSNIFIKNQQPLIADFGFCDHLYGQKSDSPYSVGSQGYMSPQAFFQKKFSWRSDIWALGAILFQMLLRKPLLQDSYPISIQKFKLQGLSQQSMISSSVRSILQLMLDFDPLKRPSPDQLLSILSMPKQLSRMPTDTTIKLYDIKPVGESADLKQIVKKVQLKPLRLKVAQQSNNVPKVGIQSLVIKPKEKIVHHRQLGFYLAQLQFCRLTYKCLISLGQIRSQRERSELKDGVLLIVKLLNLKMNQVSKSVISQNLYGLQHMRELKESSDWIQFIQQFEEFKLNALAYIRKLVFSPLSSSQQLNTLLLTVDNFTHSYLFEVAIPVIKRLVTHLKTAPSNVLLSKILIRVLRCLQLFARKINPYEFGAELADVQTYDISLSRLQVEQSV